MRLTVLTANLPRHVTLLHALEAAGHEVSAVIEPKAWRYCGPSPVLVEYWQRVGEAEFQMFGTPLIRQPCMVVERGEVDEHFVDWEWSEREIVFSSSYLTGHFAETLISRGALNLHVGIAPEFRGSAPNAWAAYLGYPNLIGAQVQRLSTGLDAGEILAEVRAPMSDDYFSRGMEAVRLGIEAMVDVVAHPPAAPVRLNDRSQQIHYSKHSDFSEDVAKAILERYARS